MKYATVSGGPYLDLDSGISTPGQIHSGLTYGTSYYYVVSAGNAIYDSPFSAELAATPGSAPILEAEVVAPGLVITPTTAALKTATSVPGHSYQLQTTADLASAPAASPC